MQPDNPQNQNDTTRPDSLLNNPLAAQAAEVGRSSEPMRPPVSESQTIVSAPSQATLIPPIDVPQYPAQNLAITQNVTDVSDKGLPGLPPVKIDNKKGKKIVLWTAIILVFGVAGYLAYMTFFVEYGGTNPMTQTIQKATGSASTLADTSTGTTSFVRPQSWTKVDESGASYGLSGNSVNTWDAIVVVTEDATDPSLVNASDSVYEQMRKTPSSNVVTDGIADRFLGRTGEKCTSSAVIAFTPDTTVSGSVVGLFVSEATCPTPKGSAILKERTVVGKDGIKRYISILAIDDEWSKNADMFQKILNSVGQAT